MNSQGENIWRVESEWQPTWRRGVEKLKDNDIVPRRATYEIVSNSPTKYREADETEEVLRRACGRHCEGKRGGKFVPGKVWHIYRIDW